MSEPLREVRLRSVIVRRDMAGNFEVTAAHAGGFIRDLGDGPRFVIERGDVSDLISCLIAMTNLGE